MPSMDLYQSHKQKRIPDTNKWIYTNLLKHTMIPEANKWSYSNLTKQNRTKGWILDANQLDLYQSPTYDHRNTNANNMDLQLHPHISKNASSKEQRGYE